ncbi:hypothetical protein Y032_0183g944 [Ancylostoma ceylanicum]|uniref:EamA domain-containing protein n=2 Tax=Ancylostoma ceylanicum TaxID=53326 RepID=A0A016SSI7_9BILA|nr:hypothetical protein Y032_0183g944 [Ancylostoma ceylanicum]
MNRNAFAYAMGAGAAGATAATASKFAFGEYAADGHYEKFAVSLVLFALSNVLMWWAYTKSLSLADSTMQCMAVNIGTNFALTGILGYVFFSESHSMYWCFGLCLVFAGVCLLASDDKEKTD